MACVDFLFHYLGVSLMPLSERERERERDTTTTTTTTTEIEIESKKRWILCKVYFFTKEADTQIGR